MKTMTKRVFEDHVRVARERVTAMDRVDGGDRLFGTIQSALEAGIRRPSTGAQYDAYVMLEYWVGIEQERLRASKIAKGN